MPSPESFVRACEPPSAMSARWSPRLQRIVEKSALVRGAQSRHWQPQSRDAIVRGRWEPHACYQLVPIGCAVRLATQQWPDRVWLVVELAQAVTLVWQSVKSSLEPHQNSVAADGGLPLPRSCSTQHEPSHHLLFGAGVLQTDHLAVARGAPDDPLGWADLRS